MGQIPRGPADAEKRVVRNRHIFREDREISVIFLVGRGNCIFLKDGEETVTFRRRAKTVTLF